MVADCEEEASGYTVPSLPTAAMPPFWPITAEALSHDTLGAGLHTPLRHMVPPARQSLFWWQHVCVPGSQAWQEVCQHTSLVLQAASLWHAPQAPSEQPCPAVEHCAADRQEPTHCPST